MRGYQLWAAGGEQARRRARPHGQAQDRRRHEQPGPGRDELPEPDLARQVRPRVRPFSTLLTAPAARVAFRYHYAFVEPAGGGPAVFAEHLGNVFFVQPAPSLERRRVREYILRCRRRSARRPRRTRRSTTRSRRRSPTHARQFEKAASRPSSRRSTPRDRRPHADRREGCRGEARHGRRRHAVGRCVRAGQGHDPAEVQPALPVPLERRDSPVEFPSKVGAGNVNGIFSSGDWFPDSKSSGNPPSWAAYVKKYGGNSLTIDSGSAEAYAVGQLIQASPRRPTPSTTRRSSSPCTRAPGRRSRAT